MKTYKVLIKNIYEEIAIYNIENITDVKVVTTASGISSAEFYRGFNLIEFHSNVLSISLVKNKG